MKQSKQEIIDFAQELYLKYDSEGKKVYSLRAIVGEIEQRFSKKLANPTILNWAKKYDWIGLNERIKQQSIEKATEEKFSKEEQLVEAESDKLAVDYKNAENLANVGFTIVMNAYKEEKHELIDFRDAISAIRLGTDIKFRIANMPELRQENTIKQILKIGDQEIEF